jgi:hypothetical protein
MMLDLAGIELEAPGTSERSVDLPPNPERSEVKDLAGELVDLVGIEPTTSSMPFSPY